jgi:hypothetical protein
MALSLTSKGREERLSRCSPEVAGGEKNERLGGLDHEMDRRFTNEVQILQDELEMHSSNRWFSEIFMSLWRRWRGIALQSEQGAVNSSTRFYHLHWVHRIGGLEGGRRTSWTRAKPGRISSGDVGVSNMKIASFWIVCWIAIVFRRGFILKNS